MDFDKACAAYKAYCGLKSLLDESESDDKLEKALTAIKSINPKDIDQKYIRSIINVLADATKDIYIKSMEEINNSLDLSLVSNTKCCDIREGTTINV